MFDIAGTVELGTICPGTGTWNRLQDGKTQAGDLDGMVLAFILDSRLDQAVPQHFDIGKSAWPQWHCVRR